MIERIKVGNLQIYRSFSKSSELSQAYKYLANFYLKKMKLDNACDAATKCLEFPEVYKK